jgi:hypothetical protein
MLYGRPFRIPIDTTARVSKFHSLAARPLKRAAPLHRKVESNWAAKIPM